MLCTLFFRYDSNEIKLNVTITFTLHQLAQYFMRRFQGFDDGFG